MAAEMHTTLLRVSRLVTNAMRFILVSRSSRLKPSLLLKCVRTISLSRISTLYPRSFKRCSMISERVLFPEPESPVNQIVKPLFAIYGILFVRLGDRLRRATTMHWATTRVVPTMDVAAGDLGATGDQLKAIFAIRKYSE